MLFGVKSEGAESLFTALANPDAIRAIRVSHVLPTNRILRPIFRWLRDRFGEKGWIASFTRIWPCKWSADMSPTGHNVVLGPFWLRKKAISAEIAWLNKNYYPIVSNDN